MIPVILGGAAAALAAWWLLIRPNTGPVVAAVTQAPAVADPVLNPIAALIPPPAAHSDLMTASANASSLTAMADPANMVPVEYQGETWLVSPQPIGPVGIGEAFSLAQSLGLSLPTPGLVDAIWRAADLHLVPQFAPVTVRLQR